MASPGRPAGKANLSGLHLRIFQLHMKGVRNSVIAQELNCSAQTVSNVLNTDFFKQAKNDVTENLIRNLSSSESIGKFSAHTIAKAVAPRMMQLNVAIAENPNAPPAVRLKAAHFAIEQAEGKATQRVVVDSLDAILERCKDEELETYMKTGQLPEWANNVSGPTTVQ